jgi:hypothetical protein
MTREGQTKLDRRAIERGVLAPRGLRRVRFVLRLVRDAVGIETGAQIFCGRRFHALKGPIAHEGKRLQLPARQKVSVPIKRNSLAKRSSPS